MDAKKNPTLSVTILNYNYAHFLPECLNSILAQDYTDFEIILINDKSTDNSLDVIQPYLSDTRIRLINHEVNKGYVYSLVEGMNESRGTYLSVISADDYALDHHAFSLAIQKMDKDSTTAFCYSAWHQVEANGDVAHTRRSADHDYIASGVDEFRRLILASPILHSGTIIRTTAYHAVGGYRTDNRYSVDTNIWLALCSVGKIAYINTPLYAYRAHNTNLSNSKGAFWQATEEMLLGIDTALNHFTNQQLPDKASLRRQAKQHALVAIPTLDIFSGRRIRGWLGYLVAFQHYPLLTLLQFRTVSLILRTFTPSSSYNRLVSTLRMQRNNTVM